MSPCAKEVGGDAALCHFLGAREDGSGAGAVLFLLPGGAGPEANTGKRRAVTAVS